MVTRIVIKKTNPIFIAGVKAEKAANKQRFATYFSAIRKIISSISKS